MIFKLILFSILYISILIFLSPIIDHFFDELDTSKSNYTILGEIILQITCVSILWYYLHKILQKPHCQFHMSYLQNFSDPLLHLHV